MAIKGGLEYLLNFFLICSQIRNGYQSLASSSHYFGEDFNDANLTVKFLRNIIVRSLLFMHYWLEALFGILWVIILCTYQTRAQNGCYIQTPPNLKNKTREDARATFLLKDVSDPKNKTREHARPNFILKGVSDPKNKTRDHARAISLVTLRTKHESMRGPLSFLRTSVTLRTKHESMREPISFLRASVTLRTKDETMREWISLVALRTKDESMRDPISFLRTSVTLRTKHESMREPISFLMASVTLRTKHESMRHRSSWLGRDLQEGFSTNIVTFSSNKGLLEVPGEKPSVPTRSVPTFG